ncbi:hypothetical protein FE257_011264 [Aspergillus nanangensis]|uniref:AT hook motif protein n=1 Tax=Aspergillus nanangensis TaxID=2582783 RepID=A0AAD4CHK0_ASPNN|nr:hypothetical protein FE257_011264 [Aspergillus nanangensis]
MGITWNEQTDAKLLVGILTTSNVKFDHKALAEFIGPECTTSAVQHRIQRLKVRAEAPEQDGEKTTSSPAETPKRGRGRPKKNADVDGSPVSKKVKTAVPKNGVKAGSEKSNGKTDGTNEVEEEEIAC